MAYSVQNSALTKSLSFSKVTDQFTQDNLLNNIIAMTKQEDALQEGSRSPTLWRVTHLQLGCPGTKPRGISSMKTSNALLQKPWSISQVEELKALWRELGAAGAAAPAGEAEGSWGEGVALSCLPQGALLKPLLSGFCMLRMCLKNQLDMKQVETPRNCLFISNWTVPTGIAFRGLPCTDKQTGARSSARRAAGQCIYLCLSTLVLFTLLLFTHLKLSSEVRKLISPTQILQSHKRANFVQESKVYGDKANVASENATKNYTQAAQPMWKSKLKTDLQQFPLSL